MNEDLEEDVMDEILSSEENCDLFMEVVMQEIQTDGETYRHKAHQLIQAYRKGDCDDLLIALCGWSMSSLINKYKEKK